MVDGEGMLSPRPETPLVDYYYVQTTNRRNDQRRRLLHRLVISSIYILMCMYVLQ
jgi:hypothetical protein